MSESIATIVQAFKGDKRRWLSLAGAKSKLPEASPDLDFFNVSGAAANPELSRISREDAVKCLARNQDAKVLALCKTPADFALSFAGIVKDGDGNGWDLLLDGFCSVRDIRDFLARYGAEGVTPETPLSKTLMESWIVGTVQTQVKDAVAGSAVEDLRNKDSLPARWWETQFNKWLASDGLSFKVMSARWESADAARAEAERLREFEMQRMVQDRERQRQAEIEEQKSKAAYEKEKARIDADQQLSDAERTHQLNVLEIRRRKELLAAETELENAKRFRERAALEHELALARLRKEEAERGKESELNRVARERERALQMEDREARARIDAQQKRLCIEADKALSDKERLHQLKLLELRQSKEALAAETALQEVRREQEQAEASHRVTLARAKADIDAIGKLEERIAEADRSREEAVSMLNRANAVLEKLSGISEPLLQQLAGRDTAKAHQAAERLVSPEFGISPSALAALGFSVAKQSLVQTLAAKQSADRQSVQLSKSDLTTRDIGAAKVKALPIGRSLQFKLVSQRAGYVTLLNLGTSGAVYLHVPNAMIGGQNIRVVEDKPYFVPGQELFPWQWDYREEGPAGWEHIVGVVSDEPVIAADILARSTAESPIVRLTPEEVGLLFAKLEDMPAEKWSSGVLSFLVG